MHNAAYDVIVIGAGHAGCEAALAAARMGCRTMVLTMRADTIAHMPCNPAIGGIAKGALVKEIDALGGEMGRTADHTGIQFRVLNRSKGPAVWGSRCQSDMFRYRTRMRKILEAQTGLEIRLGTAVDLCLAGGLVHGVRTSSGETVTARCVVISTGTFLNGQIHIGQQKQAAGRIGEGSTTHLPAALAALQLSLGRMKTGTVPRLAKDTICWETLEEQRGDDPIRKFSFWDSRVELPQVSCFITYTNTRTHDVIRSNLGRSALYSGAIQGLGPRYCPSIEDKVVKFPDRERHQVFLEPTALESEEIYPNGLSTSLDVETQSAYLRTISGLENVEIIRPGYAVEYDYVQPEQLRASLALKSIENLFLAGQINGTTGYEEAAAQGLIAGINAACLAQGRPPFILRRDEAMIGVLIDDLITRGVDEPYRMFTSRAEYRLWLREDNADLRLSQYGASLGLLPEACWRSVEQKRRSIHALEQTLEGLRLTPTPALNTALRACGHVPLKNPLSAAELLCRPHMSLETLQRLPMQQNVVNLCAHAPAVCEQVTTGIKYAGYLQRQQKQIVAFRRMESVRLPRQMRYQGIAGLSNEVIQKLDCHQPETLGQAGRISGITPAALAVLVAHMRASQRRKPSSLYPEEPSHPK